MAAEPYRFANNRTENDMADRKERLAQNVPGMFYVDSTCVDCDICRNAAPQFLRRDDEAGASYGVPASR